MSFDPGATADADEFARQHVLPHLGGDASGKPGMALICTDGELYGHHQPFRDLFLDRLLTVGADHAAVDATTPGEWLARIDPLALPVGTIVEHTSWSCHHGIARWTGPCGCTSDGGWKAALRQAFDRTASAIDTATEAHLAARRHRRLGGPRPVRRRGERLCRAASVGGRRARREPRVPRTGRGVGAHGTHGRTGVPTGDVRELWLVLGRPAAARDAPGAALRGACRAHRGWSVRDIARRAPRGRPLCDAGAGRVDRRPALRCRRSTPSAGRACAAARLPAKGLRGSGTIETRSNPVRRRGWPRTRPEVVRASSRVPDAEGDTRELAHHRPA